VKQLQAQGVSIPAIGLGTWMLRGAECERVVARALELGYRHVDTAQSYDNEQNVGRGLAAAEIPREEVFVTTKIWMDVMDRKGVEESTSRSLDLLGLGHVDLLLIHWPNDDVPLEETLGAMNELRERGLTRAVGVSNFTPSQVQRSLEIAPVATNQVEYHPFLAQERNLRLARERDLSITAYAPLGRGLALKEPTLRRLGEAHGKSPAQVTLRWLVQQDNVVAIPKASSDDHLRANLEVFDFELSADEMRQVASLDRGERLIDPDWSPDWER
jgi:diketogulonate reductase-like aldo/keto reductase